MNPLVFNHLIRLVFRHWKPFLLIVVPAVVVAWVVLPARAAAIVFMLAFVIAVLMLVGGFVRNFWRGWTGQT